MAIKISRKRLSTAVGQAGIVAAIRLEKTLHPDDEIAIDCDPSIKALACDIDNGVFPITDDLMVIATRLIPRDYDTRKVMRDWLNRNVPKATRADTIAAWLEDSSSWEAPRLFFKTDPKLRDQVYRLLRYQKLLEILNEALSSARSRGSWITPVMVSQLLLKLKGDDFSDINNIVGGILSCLRKNGNSKMIPAAAHMVNSIMRRYITEKKARELGTVVEYGYSLVDISRNSDGGFTVTIPDPHTVSEASVRQRIRDNGGRDDD